MVVQRRSLLRETGKPTLAQAAVTTSSCGPSRRMMSGLDRRNPGADDQFAVSGTDPSGRMRPLLFEPVDAIAPATSGSTQINRIS